MAFIWGTSFILIKKSLVAFTPFQSGALRMSFAFIFFLPLAITRLKKFTKQNFLPIALIGFIGNFFPAFMFAYGETLISSSLASMLNSTTPIFVLLLGVSFFKTKTNKYNILGLFIGLIGTLGLIIKDYHSIFSGWNFGALIIIIATFFYGLNTNVIKNAIKDIDGVSLSALSFFLIGPFGIAYFFITSDVSTVVQNPHFWSSTIALMILAFFSSFIAVIIFNVLIKHTTTIFAASVTYIIPVFALVWGIIDGEYISIIQIISIAIVFAGISLINKQKKDKFKEVEKVVSDV